MPTPKGKLRKGDLLKHPSEDAIFIVTERTSNDEIYSVRIQREDGKPFVWQGRSVREATLLEAHYHVFMTRGGWALIT